MIALSGRLLARRRSSPSRRARPRGQPDAAGDVGPGFTISLRDASGAGVTHLDPGDYTIHVNDLSDMHNFDLTGPGVSKSTEVTDIGEQTWDVTFTNGTYTLRLRRALRRRMKGSFTVGTVPTPPVTQKLVGSVGPGAKISLARRRKPARRRSRSATSRQDNFHLTGPGVNKKTGVAFKGTVKWTVTLKAGTYTFRSDAHKTLKGTLKVS